MNIWELPTSLNLSGVDWYIRTDFRCILGILTELNNPIFTNDEKWLVVLNILYVKFDDMPTHLYGEAYEKAIEFIDMGMTNESHKEKPRMMDWEQDSHLIIPAVNKVLGKEVRALDYMHWWTFLSAYMEIGECSYSHILSIRNKKIKGKKLEKWEQEYYSENKKIIDIQKKLTDEEKEELELEKRVLEQFFK